MAPLDMAHVRERIVHFEKLIVSHWRAKYRENVFCILTIAADANTRSRRSHSSQQQLDEDGDTFGSHPAQSHLLEKLTATKKRRPGHLTTRKCAGPTQPIDKRKLGKAASYRGRPSFRFCSAAEGEICNQEKLANQMTGNKGGRHDADAIIGSTVLGE